MTPRRVECHLMKYAKGLRGNRNNLVAIIETQEVLGGRGSMATGCVNMDCPWRSDKTKTDMFEVVMGEIDGVQGVVECFRVRIKTGNLCWLVLDLRQGHKDNKN